MNTLLKCTVVHLACKWLGKLPRRGTKGTTTEGLHVVEICTNRDENLILHRTLWAKTMDVITTSLQGESK